VIHRDADRGYWLERAVSFDAATMQAGTNVLKLTVPAGNVMSGIEYDYLRLELDERAIYNPVRPHVP
jgi:rhamnogalacturonan endolyase